MAGPISGRYGFVTFTGKDPTNARIRSWSLDVEVDTFEATGMNLTNPPTGKQRIPGLEDATGNVVYTPSDTEGPEHPGGSAVRLKLYYNATVYFEFDALLKAFHGTCEVDGKAGLSYDFEMDDPDGVYIHAEPTGSPASSPH